MTDLTGSVVWSATYAAFGLAVVDESSTITNNLRFPGQYFDAETGGGNNWNRYYDPGTGRYTQVDPIGFAGGDVNLYGYVKSNGIISIDPFGLAGLDVTNPTSVVNDFEVYRMIKTLALMAKNEPSKGVFEYSAVCYLCNKSGRVICKKMRAKRIGLQGNAESYDFSHDKCIKNGDEDCTQFLHMHMHEGEKRPRPSSIDSEIHYPPYFNGPERPFIIIGDKAKHLKYIDDTWSSYDENEDSGDFDYVN
ncbi:MAG: hypothetical protein C0622_02810 [Desulfuromonas sp.]|nr:MAG: hypothetical protein C0622_02810 [Desulfuromonas sp.]